MGLSFREIFMGSYRNQPTKETPVKKILKTLALVVTTWTLAEFFTMWRMQDTRIPLKRYVKTYFSGQKQAFAASYAAGEKLADGTSSGFKAEIIDLTHKKYYPTP